MSEEQQSKGQLSPLKRAYLAIERLQAKVAALEDQASEPIAVIGLGCRLPGAENPDAFWELLRDGTDAVREIPADRWDADAWYDPDPEAPGKMATRWGGFIDQVDEFDAGFFGISPREAISMDPQQRLLLEVVWEALEHAAVPGHGLEGSATGIFIGLGTNDYALLQAHRNQPSDLDAHYASGIANSVVSGRLSYLLGLTGPAVTLDTACSSSLVAVHLACQSLRCGETTMAIAGGVNIVSLPDNGIAFSSSSMMAPDGRCKTFDAQANGFVRAEGCGIVVLKPLSTARADGDRVLAVIRGSSVNQDGASSGLTAPNGPSQEAVIRRALDNAGLRPSDVTYIEAHGTGTSLGDPVEVHALGEVLGEGRADGDTVRIGSVKTNIGHCESAAGIAGLLKLILSLQHGEIPASLHFTEPNPLIAWEKYPFLAVASERVKWDGVGRVGGVSSFGFSGTNAHIIVGEAPVVDAGEEGVAEGVEGGEKVVDENAVLQRPTHLLPISARSEEALRDQSRAYVAALAASDSSIADVSFTAAAGRSHFEHRLIVAANSAHEARSLLVDHLEGRSPSSVTTGVVGRGDEPRVAFLFTGQGAQHAGMARELYETQPKFRRAMDECNEILASRLEPGLLDVIYGEADHTELLSQTVYTQPALFALEYSLSEMWRSWGVEPSVVIGHSVGEYAAACVAGVFSLEDGLGLIAERARLMQGVPGSGGMAGVAAGAAEVAEVLVPWADRVTLACVNSPLATVVSGETTALEASIEALEAAGLRCKRLVVSHGFHSPQMDPMLDEFAAAASRVTYAEPRIGLVSNLTGALVGPGVVTNGDYWARHVRSPVLFQQGIEAVAAGGADLFIEVGPHGTLCALGQECVESEPGVWLPTLRRGREDWILVADTVSKLYVAGVEIDWRGFDRDYPRRVVDVPTYSFQRKRHWLKPVSAGHYAAGGTVDRHPAASLGHPLLGEELRSPLVAQVIFNARLGIESLPWLSDHRVFGTSVLPGAAFLEMLLSVARRVLPQGRLSVQNLALQHALPFHETELANLQIVATPDTSGDWSVEILSHVDGDPARASSWITHASARLCLDDADETQISQTMLSDIEARCATEVPMTGLYERIAARGIELGPAFRGLESLFCAEGEALGRVRLPEKLRRAADDYEIHPALLDAALQAVSALVVSGDDTDPPTFLPTGVDSLILHERPSHELVSHVRLRSGDPAASQVLVLDLDLFDDRGRPVATLEGLRLQRTVQGSTAWADRARISQWQYRVDWQRQSLDTTVPGVAGAAALTSPARVAEQAARESENLCREHGLLSYGELLPEMDALVSSVVVRALDKLGWNKSIGERLQPETLAEALEVAPQHRRLFCRLLTFLCEQGVLQRDGEGYVVVTTPSTDGIEDVIDGLLERYPEGEAELTLVGRASPRLADCLTGTEDPLEVLFPGGSFDVADMLYRRSPPARVFNELARETVRALVNDWPADQTLRVLEIGAGTGGTTSFLLPEFPPESTAYVYTDISPLFVNRAAESFAEFPFVEYRVLDMESDPATHGFPAMSFDLVIAANVLHATSDLARTMGYVRDQLAPGGVLLMLEGQTAQSWVDVTFGMTEGWWAFTDTELRPDYPLLDRSRWRALLCDVGFEDFAAIPTEDSTRVLMDNAVIVARRPAVDNTVISRSDGDDSVATMNTPARSVVVFSDTGGTAQHLIDELRESGASVVEVIRGRCFERLDDLRYALDPTRPEDYTSLVDSLMEAGSLSPGTILHLWSLDERSDIDSPTEKIISAQKSGVRSVLHLVQSLSGAGGSNIRLCIGTRRARDVRGVFVDAAQAPLWGLAKVIGLEHPELGVTMIDLDGEIPVRDAMNLRDEISAKGAEPQVAYRRGERFVARLVPAPIDSKSLADRPNILSCCTPGIIDSLAFVPMEAHEPGPGEVQIRVRATGMNFRDVLIVLGMYPDPDAPIGGECAGEVVAIGPGVESLAVGDRVMAMDPGAFGTLTNARAELTVRIPDCVSFEEAASIPSAFVTVEFALKRLADLKAGETVLIHAAAGGVGQAAVQVAQALGAEIIATAGSPEKRAYLRDQGIVHVMDSRSLDFVEEVRSVTGGAGIDVVLNSLADEFVSASFSLLKQGGRFVELGKRGILSPEQAATQRPDVAYHVVDLAAGADQDPAGVGELLASVGALLVSGAIKPLPLQIFDREEVVDAFRFMAQARHVGKIVVTDGRDRPGVCRYPDRGVRPDRTYLITGGTGGLGLEVARWLAADGACHLALLSRGAPDETADRAIAELREQGVNVTLQRSDVANADSLAEALHGITREMPPLAGVVHAAGVLRDGVLVNMTWDRFSEVLGPKVQGAWNLHNLTREADLDFFVMFSSISTVVGSAGEGNHAAANAFLDSLASVRRATGLPAQSINWGVWSEVGSAAAQRVDERAETQGMGSMTPAEGVRALTLFMQDDRAVGAIMPVDWERFLSGVDARDRATFYDQLGRTGAVADTPRAAPAEALLEELARLPEARRLAALSEWIREQVRGVLDLDTVGEVPLDQPLQELGLDSLMAVELRNIVRSRLALDASLPSTLVFDYPTVEALADHLGCDVLAVVGSEKDREDAHSTAGPEQSVESEIDDTLRGLEELSDEEVRLALRNRMSGES